MDIQNLDEPDIELPDEFDRLPVFAVGGWVRDTIRGENPHDLDLMVAEVSPSEMRERGFTEVDNDNDTFGVFIDSLGREVAIAREEESTGDGYTDFAVTTVEPSVEAGEAVGRDLSRRDFTVNAMAYDVRHEVLHDPHGGLSDLEDEFIRAVDSTAFEQDPLRVLRGARFAARLDFEIDEETLGAMWAATERLPSLPQERARMEMEKSLVEADTPSTFFRVLDNVDALDYVFPELNALKGVPAGPPEYHGEGDAFEHTMLVLDNIMGYLPDDEIAGLMALAHDLGKGVTPTEELPSHPNHGMNGVDVIDKMAERLSMSNEQESAMKEAARYHMHFHCMEDLRESTVIDMAENIDNSGRLFSLADADTKGREPEGEFNPGIIFRRLALADYAIDTWTGSRLIDEGYDPEEMGGEEFGALLKQRRVEKMREMEQKMEEL